MGKRRILRLPRTPAEPVAQEEQGVAAPKAELAYKKGFLLGIS